MRNLIFISLFAVTLIGCEKIGLTDPSEVLSLNPQVVHMGVGDSQVFTARGDIDSHYRFSFRDDNVYFYFDMEKISSDQVKVTLIKNAKEVYNFVKIYVFSGPDATSSLIYFK